jgi:hypothetical protein
MVHATLVRCGGVKADSLHKTRLPYPERCPKSVLNNDDGKLIFLSMLESLKKDKKPLKMVAG